MKRMKPGESADQRERLLMAVAGSAMSPTQAEAEAVRLGLQPFRSLENFEKFDPRRETHWSVLMALAWIMWRDFDSVRDVWDAARATRQEWMAFQIEGDAQGEKAGEKIRRFELRPLDPASELDLLSLDNDEPQPMLSLSQARSELWRALSEARLECSGVDANNDGRQNIDPLLFQDLQIQSDPGIGVILASGSAVRSRRFASVTLEMRELLDLWPPAETGKVGGGDDPLASPATNRSKPGRKKGSGSFVAMDAPLVSKGVEMCNKLEVASANEAARQLAHLAHGRAILESKQRRLAIQIRAHLRGSELTR